MTASPQEKKTTRTKTLTFKVTEEELEAIKAHADKAGVPVAEYARDISLAGPVEKEEPGRLRLAETTDAIRVLGRQQEAMADKVERMLDCLEALAVISGDRACA